jgi:hypothetical protein
VRRATFADFGCENGPAGARLGVAADGNPNRDADGLPSPPWLLPATTSRVDWEAYWAEIDNLRGTIAEVRTTINQYADVLAKSRRSPTCTRSRVNRRSEPNPLPVCALLARRAAVPGTSALEW